MDTSFDIHPDGLLQVLIIVGAAWLLVALLQRLIPWVADRFSGRRRLLILAVLPVSRLGIIVIAVVLALGRLVEPSFEAMLAFLGTAGLSIGFALKDWVSGLVAGVVTLIEMPYRTGDWISFEGAYGEVKSIGMRSVEIQTLDDNKVHVPHVALWNSPISNASDGSRDVLCIASFCLAPDHDPNQIAEVLHDVALTSPYLNLEKPISVRANESAWGSRYLLRAYPVDPRYQAEFTTDLTLRGKSALRALGVQFSQVFPFGEGDSAEM